MISVNNVSKAFGPKRLFEDVNTSFPPGRRYGLTGPNGAGKSTFMKILQADLEPDSGQVFRPAKLGILRQNQFAYEEVRVLDVVVQGNKPLWAATQEKDALLAKSELSDADVSNVRAARAELFDRWSAIPPGGALELEFPLGETG